MTLYATQYFYDDRLDERLAVRPEHRDYLRSLTEAGKLLAAGAYADGFPGALLVFRVADEAELAATIAVDPFSRDGFLLRYEAHAWEIPLGDLAGTA